MIKIEERDEQKLQAELARVKMKKHHVISTTSTFEHAIMGDISALSHDVEIILSRAPIDDKCAAAKSLRHTVDLSNEFTRRDKTRKATRARNHQRNNAKSTNL